MYGKQSMLSNIPKAVKGLLVINAGVLLLGEVLKITANVDLARVVGLYFFKSDLFEPFQIVTHMFMHAGFMHLLFNMYALWLFGQVIERVWGPKRFLIYYFITGFGAVILHSFVKYLHYKAISSGMSPDLVDMVIREGPKVLANNKNWIDPNIAQLNLLINSPTVGASGAVMGLLLAFGMLFPNIELQLIFVPIPIKAKYFVIGYAAIEMVWGISNIPGDNVAHFAHLGGMLFGFVLIKLWGKGGGTKSNFYTQY